MCEKTLEDFEAAQLPVSRSEPRMRRILPDWRNFAVLESVFERLPEAVILYDSALVITGVNRAAERLFALPASQIIGHHCREILGCGDCDGECGIALGIANTESSPHCTLRLRTKPGRERLAVLSTTQLEDEGGIRKGV